MDALNELGSTPCHAAGSCAEILEKDRSSPSGYYWVTNGTGHPHSVYCDMTRSCGGVTGGWMRVAYPTAITSVPVVSGSAQTPEYAHVQLPLPQQLVPPLGTNSILQGVWKDHWLPIKDYRQVSNL